MSNELEKAIVEQVNSLTLEQQEKVLEFAKSLLPTRRKFGKYGKNIEGNSRGRVGRLSNRRFY